MAYKKTKHKGVSEYITPKHDYEGYGEWRDMFGSDMEGFEPVKPINKAYMDIDYDIPTLNPVLDYEPDSIEDSPLSPLTTKSFTPWQLVPPMTDEEEKSLLDYIPPAADIVREDGVSLTGENLFDRAGSMPSLNIRRAPKNTSLLSNISRPNSIISREDEMRHLDKYSKYEDTKKEDTSGSSLLTEAIKGQESEARQFARTFNPQSTADVKKLQGYLGLKQDGILGPVTEKALRKLQGVKYTPPEAVEKPAKVEKEEEKANPVIEAAEQEYGPQNRTVNSERYNAYDRLWNYVADKLTNSEPLEQLYRPQR